MTEDDPRRRLPGVDRLLERERVRPWKEKWGRRPVKRALREVLDEARGRLARGESERAPGTGDLLDRAEERLERAERGSLRPVLNATGVVLHTNLGRAPLSPDALDAVEEIARGYANLELDLDAGRRGSRYDHCAGLLCELTGAEAALVVNNNAAAVSLAVNELARGRDVVVSRGEMVEIGGSFRIPEVVSRSGGVLRGVGTTNRTRLSDYRDAAGDETGIFLKVHPSNYQVEGFSESVELEDLVALGRELEVPVVHDLGSGLLEPGLMRGFPEEPSPRGSIEAGADLVTWSGDKLLGGPQAGALVGRGRLVERLRANPLLRAFRVDKMTLAALEATLRLHRDPDLAGRRVPVLRMLLESVDAVESRASRALESAREAGLVPEGARIEVERMDAVVGGGSYPRHRMESAGWAVSGVSAERLDDACRSGDPPLVGRIRRDEYRLDFRTLLPGEEGSTARVLAAALRDIGG